MLALKGATVGLFGFGHTNGINNDEMGLGLSGF